LNYKLQCYTCHFRVGLKNLQRFIRNIIIVFRDIYYIVYTTWVDTRDTGCICILHIWTVSLIDVPQKLWHSYNVNYLYGETMQEVVLAAVFMQCTLLASLANGKRNRRYKQSSFVEDKVESCTKGLCSISRLLFLFSRLTYVQPKKS
jgi:hypothetical protein